VRYPGDALDAAYIPFPNLEYRNVLQARVEIPTLTRLLRLPKGGALLEVGCGRGVALGPLARALEPVSLAAVDIDPDLLAHAGATVRAEGLSASVEQADVRALPFPDESFDLVVDFGTCYHIARPELALAEIGRVLRPGGIFMHETGLAQLASHPLRRRRRGLPWMVVPELARSRSALLWASRRKRWERTAVTARRERSLVRAVHA
jgi:ubiquinone/menaquinone biosynthesis C-methylase UbiE